MEETNEAREVVLAVLGIVSVLFGSRRTREPAGGGRRLHDHRHTINLNNKPDDRRLRRIEMFDFNPANGQLPVRMLHSPLSYKP